MKQRNCANWLISDCINMLQKVEEPQKTKPVGPLCVDLDGTLINSDTLYELIFALIKRNPLWIFFLPVWLMRGKSQLKEEIANRVELDVSTLPYNGEFIEYLKSEKARGRKLILVTATHETTANAVSAHLGLFDEVMASNKNINLRGKAKAAALVERYGEGGFDYAGNDASDIKIWRKAKNAIVVSPDAKALKWRDSQQGDALLFDQPKPSIKTYLKAIRIHQWLKNSLIFVPLVLDHRIFELDVIANAYLAFIAFGLCASSVYLLNDLIDLPIDRKHAKKRNRPLAAGTIPIKHGVIMMVSLLALSFALSLTLPIDFTLTLLLYYAVTLSYSLYLKRTLLVDIMTLAGLYTIRIIAGGEATGTDISSWLLAFSVFFFFSLALVKRFVELSDMDENATRATTGRGYRKIDIETIGQSGIASAFASVLVLALYIDSAEVKALYTYPRMIWLLCPLVLYIIVRIWILARRGEMDDDPVVFIMSDWRSQIMVAAGVALMVFATLY